jgi:Asp-tRNA(Asn)/Glu-tRNA(Gln) amidotransferase A subunit family amidase
MGRAFEEACTRLARAGSSVTELALPQPFLDAFTAQREVNDYEAGRCLTYERVHHCQQLSSSMQARLENAARCTYEQYARAQDAIFRCMALLRELFTRYDVLLTPSTPGEAPRSHVVGLCVAPYSEK